MRDCLKGFFSKKDIGKHKKNVHTSVRKSMCYQCPKVYKNDEIPKDHLKRKHSGDRFDHPCGSCPKRFKVKRILKKHMETHISKDSEKIDCIICSKTFPNIPALQRHQQNVHNEEIIKCDICPQMLNRPKMIRHIWRHRSNKTHFCWQCKKGFKTDTELKAHETSHKEGEKVPCHVCSKELKTETGMKQHQIIHTYRERKFKCNVCSLAFLTNVALEDHSLTHTSEKPYSCVITSCGKKYNNSGSLSHHTQKHKQD